MLNNLKKREEYEISDHLNQIRIIFKSDIRGQKLQRFSDANIDIMGIQYFIRACFERRGSSGFCNTELFSI